MQKNPEKSWPSCVYCWEGIRKVAPAAAGSWRWRTWETEAADIRNAEASTSFRPNWPILPILRCWSDLRRWIGGGNAPLDVASTPPDAHRRRPSVNISKSSEIHSFKITNYPIKNPNYPKKSVKMANCAELSRKMAKSEDLHQRRLASVCAIQGRTSATTTTSTDRATRCGCGWRMHPHASGWMDATAARTNWRNRPPDPAALPANPPNPTRPILNPRHFHFLNLISNSFLICIIIANRIIINLITIEFN